MKPYAKKINKSVKFIIMTYAHKGENTCIKMVCTGNFSICNHNTYELILTIQQDKSLIIHFIKLLKAIKSTKRVNNKTKTTKQKI